MPLADWPNYPGNNPPPDQNTFLTWDFHSPQLMEIPAKFYTFFIIFPESMENSSILCYHTPV